MYEPRFELDCQTTGRRGGTLAVSPMRSFR
jgi:hypothetical protein